MKNRSEANIRVRRTYVNVSFIFVILGVSLQILTWLYWAKIIEPRLWKEASSQANVLAHSQAVKLADALIVDDTSQRLQLLHETLDEVLLFTGPQSNDPLFLGFELEVDYDVVAATSGDLDLTDGVTDCRNCFTSEVGLYSPHSDELLGIARFRVSDRLFQSLSKDVRKTLITQSSLGILLLFIVWGVVMILIKEINRSRQQAVTDSRAKSAFLANMSHELRTPLNAIIGFSELMHRDPDFAPKHRENLSIINRSGEHLLELINDVLELSKIEAAQHTVTKTSFDLYETLENVAKMVRPRLEKKDLHFILERTDDLPRYIKSDERKLRQILLNLLGNAVKFTDEGGVTLRVRPENGGRIAVNKDLLGLSFELEDTGPGIPADERKKIFDAFTQTRSGQNKKEGAGLGLTISREFVEQLGGEISVTSAAGNGTVVGFTIQAEPGVVSEMEYPQPARKVIGLGSEDGSSPDHSHRILVVDDNGQNRSLLRLLLEQVGFSVKTAQNGRQAVALNGTWRPHLIWMDMRMPIMDGYEATRMIRLTQADKGQRQPVIIALTASAFKEDHDAVLAAGCDDFVHRPYRESEIWRVMAKHLGVSYVYEEIDEVLPPQSAAEMLTDADLAASIKGLPEPLLAKLEEATELSDTDLIESAIEDIRTENARLAEVLSKMAQNFAYDKILVLVQIARELIAPKQ